MKNIFEGLPRGNARTMIVSEVFYIIGTQPFYYFLPVYLELNGLTATQMGALNSVKMLSGVILLFFSSLLINGLGRKRAIFWLDLLGWVFPFAIWFAAKSFWLFAVANALNGLYQIQVVAHGCIATEDAKPEQRAPILSVLFLLRIVGSVSITGFSWFVQRFGEYQAIRGLCLFSGLLFLALCLLRDRFLQETQAGRTNMRQAREQSVAKLLRRTVASFLQLVRRENLFHIAVINIVVTFISVFVFYNVLFIQEVLFAPWLVSLTPVITMAGGLVTYKILMPRLDGVKETRCLALSLAIMTVAAAAIVLSKWTGIAAYLVYAVCNACGNLLLLSYSGSVLMNQSGEEEKADIYSAVMLVSTLLGIPAGALGGAWYETDPVLPFVGMFAVTALALLCSVRLDHITKNEKRGTGYEGV